MNDATRRTYNYTNLSFNEWFYRYIYIYIYNDRCVHIYVYGNMSRNNINNIQGSADIEAHSTRHSRFASWVFRRLRELAIARSVTVLNDPHDTTAKKHTQSNMR
jgi:hypothetical protein